jgi:CBS domain containing-hemolysin-like protein
MQRRSVLLTIGGFFFGSQFARAQNRSTRLQSLQVETGRAAGRVAQVGKGVPQTQSAVRLCHLLTNRCEQNSPVSPALVQATLDATRRARLASGQTEAFLQSTTAFQQLAERLIEATA